MQVAHVLGLAHSGTTIVDRILASYPGAAGLGEVERLWRRVEQGTASESLPCPCGATALACPFWSAILSRNHATQEDFFRAVVETGERQGYRLLVDTSSSLAGSSHYGRMMTAGVLDGLVHIRLVRDPRGWVHSMMRRNEIDASDVTAIRGLFYRWLISSIGLDHQANRPGANRIYVWYDKLVLGRGQNELAELMGLSMPEGGEISLDRANQHAVAGNKFVFSDRRASLSYDPRWLESIVLNEIYAELPAVRAYYHEVQKLHLTKGMRMTQLPKIDRVAKRRLMQAIACGAFAIVEEAVSDLSVVADLSPSKAEVANAA